MTKRIWIAVLALLLALAALPALGEAEGEYLGSMQVVNCREWVSLREAPDTGAARLAQVPLGAVVTDCRRQDARFIHCAYEGQEGYILSEYLAPAEDGEAEAGGARHTVLDEVVDGIHVSASRVYGEGEALSILAVNEAGYPIWTFSVRTDYVTELDGTAVFLGGTENDPRVMVYSSGDGLYALRLETGEVIWHLEERFGGSVTAVVAGDGTTYLGGYYGPNLAAVSPDGELLWVAADNAEVFWLYDLALTDEGIVATYDHIPGDREGQICYGWDGDVLWMK